MSSINITSDKNLKTYIYSDNRPRITPFIAIRPPFFFIKTRLLINIAAEKYNNKINVCNKKDTAIFTLVNNIPKKRISRNITITKIELNLQIYHISIEIKISVYHQPIIKKINNNNNLRIPV